MTSASIYETVQVNFLAFKLDKIADSSWQFLTIGNIRAQSHTEPNAQMVLNEDFMWLKCHSISLPACISIIRGRGALKYYRPRIHARQTPSSQTLLRRGREKYIFPKWTSVLSYSPKESTTSSELWCSDSLFLTICQKHTSKMRKAQQL